MSETHASSPAPIVVALAFDATSVFALRRAAEIFRRSPACSLELLHVLYGVPELESSEVGRSPAAARIRSFVDEHLGDPSTLAGRPVGIHVRVGEIAPGIVAFGQEVDAQLLVVGSHARTGIARRILGSTAEDVLRLAHVPVVVATGDPATEAPAIEPPCEACLRARAATRGSRWWCERHSQHHAHGHAFSYRKEWPYELHDSEVIPSGVDLG